jgi:hypothetical protein
MEENLVYAQIMQVHQETIDSFLETLTNETIQETSEHLASLKSHEYHLLMQEHQYEDEGDMISDLVTSFLIPYVERRVTKSVLENEMEQYLMAAHHAIYQEISVIPPIQLASEKAKSVEVLSASVNVEAETEAASSSVPIEAVIVPKTDGLVDVDENGLALPPLPK